MLLETGQCFWLFFGFLQCDALQMYNEVYTVMLIRAHSLGTFDDGAMSSSLLLLLLRIFLHCILAVRRTADV